jgi:hypothetical protein
MSVDRFDVTLLGKCSTRGFEFMKTDAQESRTVSLAKRGLLERKSKAYRMTRSGASIEFRWAYRLTPAGRAVAGLA